MAELLAVVSGVAAGTQLFHYGMRTFTTASALTRYRHHAPEIVRGWTDEISAMLHYIDTVRERGGAIDLNTTRLLELCRKDALALLAILQPLRDGGRLSKHQRLREIVLVLRKQGEVDALMRAFDQKYTRIMLTLCL